MNPTVTLLQAINPFRYEGLEAMLDIHFAKIIQDDFMDQIEKIEKLDKNESFLITDILKSFFLNVDWGSLVYTIRKGLELKKHLARLNLTTDKDVNQEITFRLLDVNLISLSDDLEESKYWLDMVLKVLEKTKETSRENFWQSISHAQI